MTTKHLKNQIILAGSLLAITLGWYFLSQGRDRVAAEIGPDGEPYLELRSTKDHNGPEFRWHIADGDCRLQYDAPGGNTETIPCRLESVLEPPSRIRVLFPNDPPQDIVPRLGDHVSILPSVPHEGGVFLADFSGNWVNVPHLWVKISTAER